MLGRTALGRDQINLIAVGHIHQWNRDAFARTPTNHIDQAYRSPFHLMHKAPLRGAVNQHIKLGKRLEQPPRW
jgi:hypothetical protein